MYVVVSGGWLGGLTYVGVSWNSYDNNYPQSISPSSYTPVRFSAFTDLSTDANAWSFWSKDFQCMECFLVVENSTFTGGFTCSARTIRSKWMDNCLQDFCFRINVIIRLHNEELNDLYSSPNIVWVIKSRRMRCPEHVARMGEERGFL